MLKLIISQEDDKSVNFTQKYLRWDSLASLKKSLTSEDLLKRIVNPVNSLAFQIIASVSRDLNPFMRTIFVADDSFAVISENQISYSTYRTKKFIALL